MITYDNPLNIIILKAEAQKRLRECPVSHIEWQSRNSLKPRYADSKLGAILQKRDFFGKYVLEDKFLFSFNRMNNK